MSSVSWCSMLCTNHDISSHMQYSLSLCFFLGWDGQKQFSCQGVMCDLSFLGKLKKKTRDVIPFEHCCKFRVSCWKLFFSSRCYEGDCSSSMWATKSVHVNRNNCQCIAWVSYWHFWVLTIQCADDLDVERWVVSFGCTWVTNLDSSILQILFTLYLRKPQIAIQPSLDTVDILREGQVSASQNLAVRHCHQPPPCFLTNSTPRWHLNC
jgi:hypothetical protein